MGDNKEKAKQMCESFFGVASLNVIFGTDETTCDKDWSAAKYHCIKDDNKEKAKLNEVTTIEFASVDTDIANPLKPYQQWRSYDYGNASEATRRRFVPTNPEMFGAYRNIRSPAKSFQRWSDADNKRLLFLNHQMSHQGYSGTGIIVHKDENAKITDNGWMHLSVHVGRHSGHNAFQIAKANGETGWISVFSDMAWNALVEQQQRQLSSAINNEVQPLCKALVSAAKSFAASKNNSQGVNNKRLARNLRTFIIKRELSKNARRKEQSPDGARMPNNRTA